MYFLSKGQLEVLRPIVTGLEKRKRSRKHVHHAQHLQRKESESALSASSNKSANSDSDGAEQAQPKEVVVTILEEGCFFGEIGLLFNQTRSASVRARINAEICVLAKEDFLEVLSDFPGQRAIIEGAATRRMRRDTRRKSVTFIPRSASKAKMRELVAAQHKLLTAKAKLRIPLFDNPTSVDELNPHGHRQQPQHVRHRSLARSQENVASALSAWTDHKRRDMSTDCLLVELDKLLSSHFNSNFTRMAGEFFEDRQQQQQPQSSPTHSQVTLLNKDRKTLTSPQHKQHKQHKQQQQQQSQQPIISPKRSPMVYKRRPSIFSSQSSTSPRSLSRIESNAPENKAGLTSALLLQEITKVREMLESLQQQLQARSIASSLMASPSVSPSKRTTATSTSALALSASANMIPSQAPVLSSDAATVPLSITVPDDQQDSFASTSTLF